MNLPNPQAFFEPVLQALLQRALDHNKAVQEAACSALSSIIQAAGADSAPYLEPILRTFMQAYNTYQMKALFILYEAIGSLAFAVGQEFIVRFVVQPYIMQANCLIINVANSPI